MKIKRRWFGRRIERVDARRLVFLDESGAQTNMTRLHGRSPIGQRLHASAPAGHWQTTTMLSAIDITGVIQPACLALPGPIDATSFCHYIEQMLAPALKPGQIVVMDNLAAHKVNGVREAIEAVGCEAWYLPPYSPDFNPIEKMWSKVKALVRRAEARSIEALYDAIGHALRRVGLDECRNYFRSCGYAMDDR